MNVTIIKIYKTQKQQNVKIVMKQNQNGHKNIQTPYSTQPILVNLKLYILIFIVLTFIQAYNIF